MRDEIQTGIQLHSTASASASYVILSCKTPARLHSYFATHAIGFKQVTGCYKGEEEISYIINAKYFPTLKLSGIIDDQESVLVLSDWKGSLRGCRHAALHFLDGSLPVSLGRLVSTSEEDALECDAWTRDTDGQYFITKA